MHLDKNHPVRYLLDSSAGGQRPGTLDLNVLDRPELPDDQNLTVFAADVEEAAERVAELGAKGMTGEARRLAEEEWRTIAEQLSPAQRAVVPGRIAPSVRNTQAGNGDDQPDIDAMVGELFN